MASDSGEDLRQHFTNLSLLLALVTALNDGERGSSHSTPHASVVIQEKISRETKNTQQRVMDAILSVFVRDVEILAAMAIDKHMLVTIEETRDVENLISDPVGPLDWRPGVDQPETMLKVPRLATLKNYDRERDRNSECSLKNQITLTPPGVSSWDDIKNSGSGVRFEMDPRTTSLKDHIATVCGYLNWYKDAAPDDRLLHSRKFMEYLVSVCWRKMERRATHWGAIGLWCNLSSIDDHEVQAAAKSVLSENPVASDSRLARRLRQLDHDSLRFILGHLQWVSPKNQVSGLANPPIPGSEGVSVPLQALMSAASDQQQSPNLYTLNTCVDFHHLLVATLGTHIAGLHHLRQKLKSDPPPPSEELFKIVQSIIGTGSLLAAIAHSEACKTHFLALTREPKMRVLPFVENVDKYSAFAEDHHICMERSRPRKSPITNSIVDPNADVNPDTSAANVVPDDSTTRDGEEEDTDFSILIMNADGYADQLCSWMKLFTKHFTAKRALESYCALLGPGDKCTVEVSLLHAELDKSYLPTWDQLEATLQSTLTTFPSVRFTLNDVITTLRSGVYSTLKPGLGSPRRKLNSIFHAFHAIFEKQDKFFSYPMHCELAILAAAIAVQPPCENEMKIGNKEVIGLLKKLDPRYVAVSKRCCPVCSEFMKTPRVRTIQQGPSGIRSHPTLSPVKLPPWLDDDITRTLISKFQRLLSEALAELWSFKQSSKHRHISIESSGSGQTTTSSAVSEPVLIGTEFQKGMTYFDSL